MGNIAHKTRSAKQQLIDAGWCVSIGRDLIEAHAKSDFGALIALAAVLAWRDRGPGWLTDGKRSAAQTPPTGWPAMVGTTPKTWRRWRDRAIEIGLIFKGTGVYNSGAKVPTLRPIAPYRTEEQDQGFEIAVEQFARIPCAVLFDEEIGRGAKRVMLGLALFRNAKGFAKVAVPTIARVAGLNDRNTQLGLRRLELAGAIKSNGLDRRVQTYEICEQRIEKGVTSDTRGGHERHQGGHERHQKGVTSDTRGVTSDTRRGSPATPFQVNLSGKASNKINQQKTFRGIYQAPNSLCLWIRQSLFSAHTHNPKRTSF